MLLATEQRRKRKRDDQTAKKSAEQTKIRFLNMSSKQIKRRYNRDKQRCHRSAQLQSKPRPATLKTYPRKGRPCCGLQSKNCKCKPIPGMKKLHLNALGRRFAKTSLCTVQDTTDVSTFQTLMATRCQTLPLRVLLAYAHTHVVFNQDHLLHSFIEQKAFLFKPPWFNWQKLQSIVQKSKQQGKRFRSSNYRSTTLRKILLPRHIGKARLLQSTDDTVERAVLACRIVGEDAMPGACMDLYDKSPSRDLWRASMLTWLDQVHSKCSGCFNHYYLKCSLDRAFAVRTFSSATISWWPTECPSYLNWYKLIYPNRALNADEKFQILCTTYMALNQKRICSIPESLAQTCWVKMENGGRLHVEEAF